MWFLGERIVGAVEVLGERQKREEHTGEHTRRTFPQSHWLGKQEGLIFVSSCNQLGLKHGVLKVSRLGRDRSLRVLPYSWREGRQTTLGQMAWKQLSEETEECLGHTGGYYLLFLEHIPDRQGSGRCLFGDKGTGWHHFPPLPLSINTEPNAGSNTALNWLPKLLTPMPLHPSGTAVLS